MSARICEHLFAGNCNNGGNAIQKLPQRLGRGHSLKMEINELGSSDHSWLVVWILFLFFKTLGRIIPTDFHIFQRSWNHQPDSLCCSIFGPAKQRCGSVPKRPLTKKPSTDGQVHFSSRILRRSLGIKLRVEEWKTPYIWANRYPAFGPTDTHPFGVFPSVGFPVIFLAEIHWRQVQASLARACSLRRWYRFISGLIEKLGNIRGFP